MNEFEKWVEYYSRYLDFTSYPICSDFTEKEKHYCMRAWEAALEWVQTCITERLKMASSDDNVACVRSIEDDVKEELGVGR